MLSIVTELVNSDIWIGFAVKFFEEWRWVFAICGLLYVPAVFGAVKFMQDKTAIDGPGIKKVLIGWNFLMAIFSGIGALLTIPSILYFFYQRQANPVDLICGNWIYDQPLGVQYAVFAFLVSKVFEFIDTVFLVLRKRNVIFLHWYHHVITFLFTWYSTLTTQHHNTAGYLFCSMNYTVHAFMYLYYALQAAGRPPKWDLPITIMQLAQ